MLINNLFNEPEKYVNKDIEITGRIKRIRVMGGNLTFFLLDNYLGTIQCVSLSDVKCPPIESIINVKGKLTKSNVKQGLVGYEIAVQSLKIVSLAIELPYTDIRTIKSRNARILYRHLDLRDKKIRSIFKIRSEILYVSRCFLRDNNFDEITTPKIVGDISKGPVGKIGVDFFGKKANLSVSGILYHGITISGDFLRVFEIGSAYSGEKTHTAKTLNEYSVIEFSAAFCSINDILKISKELLNAIYEHILKVCKKELAILNTDLSSINMIFTKITYDDIVNLLNNNNISYTWGESHELPSESHGVIKKHFSNFLWLLNQPKKQKWFFLKSRKVNNRDVCCDCQLWYPDNPFLLAEGGERETDPDRVIDNIISQNLDPEYFKFYINALKHGIPPYAGIGIGVERLLMLLLKQENIREVVLFPRDSNTLEP